MESASKADAKNAIREKNRISAKDFIKMKRGQAKEEKNSSESFQRIRGFISEGAESKLDEFLFTNKAQFVLTFLFSEDQIKQTPLMQIIKNYAIPLLQVVNKWSIKNSDWIIREIYIEGNELKTNHFKGKFQALNKIVMEVINEKIAMEKETHQMIQLLGEKDGIFYHLCKNYLNLELVVSTITSFKTKNDLLSQYYMKLLTSSDLRELTELATNVSGYQSIIIRDKLWKKVDADMIKTVPKEFFNLLTLNELKYNIWHELANKSASEFFKTCDYIANLGEEHNDLREKYWQMLLEIDSSGESVTDKCLRQWKLQQILKVFEMGGKIDNIMLTTNSLNNLFYNRHLNQMEREKLITQCLEGDISTKGYIKVITKNREKQWLRKGGFKDTLIILQVKPIKYTYSICYDKGQLKRQRDNAGSYPLVTYLKIYKTSANLKTVQQLFLQFLNRKEIKKKLSLLYKVGEQKRVKIDKKSVRKEEIQNLLDYYQPLWKIMTFLPHGDTLDYLLSKIYTNCYEIKLTKSSTDIEAELGGKHFIVYYIENNIFLGEDAINKQLIDSIVKCKPNQKLMGKFNLDIELVRALNHNDFFHNSQDYLIVTLRNYLKPQLLNLSFNHFLQKDQNKKILLDVIAEPLSTAKASLLNESDIIKICDPEALKNDYEVTFKNVNRNQLPLKNFYKDILTKMNVSVSDQKQFDVFSDNTIRNYFHLQSAYSSLKLEKKNELFFDEVKKWFSQQRDIQNANQSLNHRFHCFRLSPFEKHLTYKFKRLLEYGLDPYFSKYNNKSIEFTEQNHQWNVVMGRMIKQKRTFLGALITSPTSKFQAFKEIFEVNLSCKEYNEEWIKWSLIKKVQHGFKLYKQCFNALLQQTYHPKTSHPHIKDSMYLIPITEKGINFQLIVDILQFAVSYGLKETQFVSSLQYYFMVILRYQSMQITNNQHTLSLGVKDQQKQVLQSKINKWKENLELFINRWLPFIKEHTLKMKSENNNSQTLQIFLMKLIRYAFNQNNRFLGSIIIKNIEFQRVCESKYVVDKLEYSREPDQILSVYLMTLNDEAISRWNKQTISTERHRLLELGKKFSLENQVQILNHLFDRIHNNEDLIKKGQKPVSSYTYAFFVKWINLLAKLFLLGISKQNIPSILKIIHTSEISSKLKQSYKCLLLTSVEEINLRTLALIVMDPENKYYFYNKQNEKVKKLHVNNFYSKCNDNNFAVYLKNLEKYYDCSPNIAIHLKIVVNSLIESESWQRLGKLFQIKSLMSHVVPLTLKTFYKTSNKKIRQNHPQAKDVINKLFSYLQSVKIEFNEDLFVAAFSFDPVKSFSIFKPQKLSIYGFRACIPNNPEHSSLFVSNKVTLNHDYLPDDISPSNNKRLKRLFPMVAHSKDKISSNRWLIDQLKVELSILKDLESQNLLIKTLKTFCTSQDVLAHKKQIYEGVFDDTFICQSLMRCTQIQSLSNFQKYIPELKKIVGQQLFELSSKSECMNLNILRPTVLKQFITNKSLSSAEPKKMYSCFLRVIDTANMPLIELFLATNKITITHDYLKNVQECLGVHFWDHFLSICNQDFLIAFITKFKLFDIYGTEEYSQKLLNTICRLKWNKLLEFTIKYFQNKSGGKLIFVAETTQNKPSISDKGVFYLPIQESMENNFYEVYFLIQGSNNQCPLFKLSGRFLSYVNPQTWNYIPEMKRRVQINNTFMESLREAQQMEFRFKVLLPSIFQLQTPKKQQPQEEQYHKKKGSPNYSDSLSKFINDVTRKSIHLNFMSGIFQKLCFMILKKKQTKIPESQLQKRYPSEMKIINKIRKFVETLEINISLTQLFEHVPQFKSHLLIYNPSVFLQNQQYMRQIMGLGDKKLDFSQYLRGIQINLMDFTSKYNEVLQRYIDEYFFNCSIPLGNPEASLHLTRQALLLLFIEISQNERKWNECMIFNLCRPHIPFEHSDIPRQTEAPEQDERLPEQVLYDIAKCLNFRVRNVMAFDLMVWNKIVGEIQQIQAFWAMLGKGTFKEYKFDANEKNQIIMNYLSIVTKKLKRYKIDNLKDIFSEIYEEHLQNCNKSGVFIELQLVLNIFLLQNDLKILEQKVEIIKGGKQIKTIHLNFVKKITKSSKFQNPSEIYIQIPYSIAKHESKQLSLLLIDYHDVIKNIQHSLYLSNLQTSPSIAELNDYCSKIERQPYLKNYKFKYTVQSFKHINYESLTNILEHGHLKNDGAVGRIMHQLEKMEERLLGTKNIKIYSSSDIYGPINFSQEKQNEKIIDCLGFYQLIELSKAEDIKVTYNEKVFSPAEKNQLALQHIRNYLKFYIATCKDENLTEKLDMENEILVSIRKNKNEQKVQIQWWRFGAWTICEIYCLALSYCSDLSCKIDKILDVRVSFMSLINYYQKYLECGNDLSIKIALERLLFQKQFNRLVESIIIMITEDVGNIMKIVKGIIIKWAINNKNAKKTSKLVISEFASAISVDYEVKDQLLNITINLQMRKGLNPANSQQGDCNLLVDRKQFLDSVFTSAQFLADYFLMRNQLNNECLRISTTITNKLNTTVNFHIEYSNLYAHVEKMRGDKSIKDIESLLIRLKQYLHNSMDKVINLYLNSQELANKHQVFILNKCEAINKGLPFNAIESQKELIYDSLEQDSQNGLSEVISLMNQIGNDQNIKSTFLIQIYKSYYTTMVGEGMTFVVGYKSSKKKSQVIKITKAENINLINIVELDFIMLVSKNIPTNDELNQSKIIRIFITDSNKNLYQLNNKIKQHFLTLPQESQERNIAYFAPLIQSNVMLTFSLNEKKQLDTKDTKIFFIDLNQSSKFKLAPNNDKPLTPLNSCKKNLEFKDAIAQLKKGFKNFYKENFKFIIDLPEEFTETYINANFSHIIHLVSTDLLQFLMKFEFEPMRNESLDCKLSIQKQFQLNKNSIIELRKRAFMKHYGKLRIRIRDSSAGITFNQNEIIVCIDVTNMTSLPSSSQYLSMIVDNILKKQKQNLQKYVSFKDTDKNQSTEILLKELDLLNSIPYQVEQIQQAIKLINLLCKKNFSQFKISIHRKKTEIKFEPDIIEFHFNVETVEREFFSSEQIIKAYVAFMNKNFEANTKAETYFNPLKEQLCIEQCSSDKFRLIYRNLESQLISQQVTNIKEAFKNIKQKCLIPSKYYIYESDNIYSNFFFKVSKELAIAQKNSEGIRCKAKHLYLQSQKTINLNFTNIFINETNPLFKENTNNFNILRSPVQKNKIIIKLLSKNIYQIMISYDQSMILNINYAGNINIFNPQLESTKLVISSDGQLCLDNTKFIQLQAFKKKPVLIKDKQYQNKNSEFRQFNELASDKELEIKLGDKNNIQNLVYVVNDECKKYLTRAGEPRVDYIQLCDTDNNPIDFKGKLDVMLVHINRLDIVRPQIIPRNMQFGLSWTPTVRGHYYIYINSVRMNPPYEIGVCAAQADYKTTIVTIPKVKKICYCEESQLMLDLRDSFGNLYTQLQQDILGDSLLIELRCSRLIEVLKIQKSQINKYGLKKLKFSFNNTEDQKMAEIQISVYLNCQFVSKFILLMEGLSLKQRKKLLEKDISLSSKNYYKDISINRNRFLEDLFVVAQKSLHTNLSVRFVNEPGIDAGGVKREFYDMIGNELKSQRNPFFKLINPNTMEYFLNPQILRNKKKLEYMELWGKYLANSLLNSYLIGVSFSPVFIKLLYEQSIDYEDLLSVLPAQEKKQYDYLLTASPEDFQDLDLYFTVMIDKKKCIEVELKEGGQGIQVTAENVKEYLQCTAQMLLTERYKEIMIAFRKGFETVLQLGIFKKWIRNSEFWCLTAGNKEITPELVLNYIVFQGHNIDNISGWFRRFISEANHEVLVGFLKFSSGSSSIDFSLASKITVTFENAGENPKKLPISHTCWKEIVVPKYKNYDILKKLLTAAFIYCSEGFGFG